VGLVVEGDNDRGRVVTMWNEGVFDRIPSTIDHATVGVEAEGRAWSVFMRDVSDVLVPHARRVDRVSVRRVLVAMADLHGTFWGEDFPDLCGLEDRYRLLSPETMRREQQLGTSVGDTLTHGWDVFSELVPADIADAVFAILDQPALLANQLATCQQTLIHGDVRLSNLGLGHDRIVLIDWGERTGTAPPAVELASFLGFDASRLQMSREEVIAEFRRLCGEHFEGKAMQLALLGGFVQLGWHFGLGVAHAENEGQRAAALTELSWWTRTAENALDTWSPR